MYHRRRNKTKIAWVDWYYSYAALRPDDTWLQAQLERLDLEASHINLNIDPSILHVELGIALFRLEPVLEDVDPFRRLRLQILAVSSGCANGIIRLPTHILIVPFARPPRLSYSLNTTPVPSSDLLVVSNTIPRAWWPVTLNSGRAAFVLAGSERTKRVSLFQSRPGKLTVKGIGKLRGNFDGIAIHQSTLMRHNRKVEPMSTLISLWIGRLWRSQ